MSGVGLLVSEDYTMLTINELEARYATNALIAMFRLKRDWRTFDAGEVDCIHVVTPPHWGVFGAGKQKKALEGATTYFYKSHIYRYVVIVKALEYNALMSTCTIAIPQKPYENGRKILGKKSLRKNFDDYLATSNALPYRLDTGSLKPNVSQELITACGVMLSYASFDICSQRVGDLDAELDEIINGRAIDKTCESIVM